jgi:uncharacterized protein (DUF58 family)
MHTGIARWVMGLAVLATLGGCAGSSKHMMATAAVAGPAPGKALIVFMRPSKLGFAIDAPVFHLVDDREVFVGIVSAGTRVDYQVVPGNHAFMVSSEVSDFLDANVVAGRTYYVIVEPRMGAWKARFSLSPVRRGPPAEFHMGLKGFRGWVNTLRPETIGPSAVNWYEQNKAAVAKMRVENLPKWSMKPPEDLAEATLNEADGE